MKNQNRSFLDQLYTGEFFPAESVVSGNPDYVRLARHGCDEIEYITGRLNDEDKARFEKLVDTMSDTGRMDQFANFAYGLRTGIMLMYELFLSDNKPPFRRE